MTSPTVIIAPCAEYDTLKIKRIVSEGLKELELTPHGRTLIKPNVVASGDNFPHAYTRPEFVEGVALALKERAARDERAQVDEWAIGERCGITMPTRLSAWGLSSITLMRSRR